MLPGAGGRGGVGLEPPLRSLGVNTDAALKNAGSSHPTRHEPGVNAQWYNDHKHLMD